MVISSVSCYFSTNKFCSYYTLTTLQEKVYDFELYIFLTSRRTQKSTGNIPVLQFAKNPDFSSRHFVKTNSKCCLFSCFPVEIIRIRVVKRKHKPNCKGDFL